MLVWYVHGRILTHEGTSISGGTHRPFSGGPPLGAHPRFVRVEISAPPLRFSHRPLPIGIFRETLALLPFEQDVHAAIDGCFFAKLVVGIDLHILILRREKRASA